MRMDSLSQGKSWNVTMYNMIVTEEVMDVDLMKHTTGWILGVQLEFGVEDMDLKVVVDV